MTFNLDYKTLTSFVVSILLVGVQAVQGVYDGGISGLEWLGIAAVLVGPAGLVAAVNNTPWSPATKALAQHVSAVAIILIQGVTGVYSHGISQTEWLGLALLLLSTLAVYVVPGNALVAGRHRNQVGYALLGAIGAVLLVVAVVLLILTLLKVFLISWVVLLVMAIIGVVLIVLDGRSGGRVV